MIDFRSNGEREMNGDYGLELRFKFLRSGNDSFGIGDVRIEMDIIFKYPCEDTIVASLPYPKHTRVQGIGGYALLRAIPRHSQAATAYHEPKPSANGFRRVWCTEPGRPCISRGLTKNCDR